MRAFVVFQLPDGEIRELEHGDIIGRMWTAGLVIDDPRVSEAHAMVSLRGGELGLLSLRRMFAVDGKPVSDCVLRAGQVVALAEGVTLKVEAVCLPDAVLGLEGPGLPTVLLPGVCSLRVAPRPELLPSHVAGADAWIWSTGMDWKLRLRDQPDRSLRAGDSFEINGLRYVAVSRPLSEAGPKATRVEGGVQTPLRIVARFDSVQIHRQGSPVVVIGGQPGRVLSELATMGGLVDWAVVAGEIWPEESDEWLLRRKWDVNLGRLRQKLKDAHVRADLLRSDGLGHIELVLTGADEVIDES